MELKKSEANGIVVTSKRQLGTIAISACFDTSFACKNENSKKDERRTQKREERTFATSKSTTEHIIRRISETELIIKNSQLFS